jgi:pimeloyl-ACP methyl ester carboxylesterase
MACRLEHGVVTFYLAQPFGVVADRPVVAMAHGALRNASVLAPWADLLLDIADVVLIDLPGHGRSDPIAPASVKRMGFALAEAIDRSLAGRRVLLVGESIGGTIALAAANRADPGPIRAVFAADPPVTTAKQWSVATNFRRFYRQAPENAFARDFGRETFGITADGIEEIIYYPLIGELNTPAVIATGDISLLPPRPVDGVTCLFDQVDQFVLAEFYAHKAELRRIDNCGHLLLTDARPRCLEIIRSMLAEHLAWIPAA